MSILQHYRTSFQDPKRGHAGFGTKAASSGVTPEMETQLLRLNSYTIPRDLDERDIASHPIALRYLYVSPVQCILLCSQSCGSDELGRAGNYFAHSLILSPDDLPEAPIFYWRSRFWKNRDTSDQSILPALPIFDVEPSLDPDQISTFLAQGKRASQFRKLLSAVIYSSKTARRIVILDTADNVAFWVAAVSVALPPYYRPFLSFATYHHDPYQVSFMITGTTSSSTFRFSPDEYVTYFILNAETGMVSEVEDSKYAERVTDLLLQDLNHDDLLTLFETAMRRFPHQTQITDQLDQVVDYLEVLKPDRQTPLTPSQLDSVHLPRETFAQLPKYEEEDRKELQRLTTTLAAEVQAQPGKAVVREYVETLRTLSKGDTRAIDRVPEDLLVATRLLMDPAPEKVQWGADLIQTLRQEIFKDQPRPFRAKLNSLDYLPKLNSDIQRASAGRLLPIWHYVGRYLDAGEASLGLLVSSLRAAAGTNDHLTSEELNLFKEMRGALKDREPSWLQLAVKNRARLPPRSLNEFYYYIILGGLPADGGLLLDDRVPCRQIIEPLQQDILQIEIESDLAEALQKSDDKVVLSVLEGWTKHARSQRLDVGAVLKVALSQIPDQELRALAPTILLSSTLKRDLPDDLKRGLLKIVFQKLTFHTARKEHALICQEYKFIASRLAETTEILVVGVLAMWEHSLDKNEASKLRRRFSRMSDGEYEEELKAFAARFFEPGISGDTHGQMVAATYRWEFREVFWQCYWSQFKGLLLDQRNADLAVTIMSFWFDSSLNELNNQTFVYVIQGFFLGLPDVVAEMRKEHGFRQTAERINTRAARQEWYPLIRDIFAVERRGFFSLFGR